MPIRLRLTLWYTLIFGILLISVALSMYLFHRMSQYRETDRLLTGVSQHVQEELEQEIQEGKPLAQAVVSFEEFYLNGVYIVIKDATGTKLLSSANPFRVPDAALPEMEHDGKTSLHTFSDPSHGRVRMLVRPIYLGDQLVGFIQSEISLNQIDTALNRFQWMSLSIIFIGLILTAIGGWFLARKALYRVEFMNQTAKAIAASQNFQQRVLYTGPRDELGELAETFNEMLESLENAFVSQKRFIADASHELRAPLTTIRGNLDILHRAKQIPLEDQQEILQDTRKEAVRMTKLVSELLSLARADAGQEIRMGIVDLSGLHDEVVQEIRGWSKQINIECKSDLSVKTWGNEDLLKQLLLIFTENAIRYTPDGGIITLSTSSKDGRCIIRVSDTGIGIDPQDLPHIFDRFYRAERARLQCLDGSGLGLAIGKWIVEQHGGSIIVTSIPGQGTEFQVSLPKVKD